MSDDHRPGPWRLSKYRDGSSIIVTDAEGFDVCAVHYPNRDATARLIASAPDMAAEIERLRGEVSALTAQINGSAIYHEGAEAQMVDLEEQLAAERAEVERLRAEVERLNSPVLLSEWQQQEAEIERLRNALHGISLSSQNSMSSKEGIGREARAALAGGRSDE